MAAAGTAPTIPAKPSPGVAALPADIAAIGMAKAPVERAQPRPASKLDVRGVIRGIEGRSVYRRDRDFDHDRGLHRGWDRDRGYGYRHRGDDDD
jgi:hypothetical protein